MNPESIETLRWIHGSLTGDTLYRGRLYVEDFAAFLASLERLVAFAESRPVSHVMGCHIEMTRVAEGRGVAAAQSRRRAEV
jgi:hypothetical protein